MRTPSKHSLLYIFTLTALRPKRIKDLIEVFNRQAVKVTDAEKSYNDYWGIPWYNYYIEPIKVEEFTDNPGQWPMIRMHFEVRAL